MCDEGEPIHAQSVISLPIADHRCILPPFTASRDDPFLRKLDASGLKWIIVTNPQGEPEFVLDSHYFLRDALFNQLESNPGTYWHRPIIVRDSKTRLGDVLWKMTVVPERPGDDVIVEVMEIKGQTVRLGIDAPRSLPVFREEIWLDVKRENEAAARAPEPLPDLQSGR